MPANSRLSGAFSERIRGVRPLEPPPEHQLPRNAQGWITTASPKVILYPYSLCYTSSSKHITPLWAISQGRGDRKLIRKEAAGILGKDEFSIPAFESTSSLCAQRRTMKMSQAICHRRNKYCNWVAGSHLSCRETAKAWAEWIWKPQLGYSREVGKSALSCPSVAPLLGIPSL